MSADDQSLLVRLGQSQSRILVAALHWYDPEAGNFRNFLSWRESRPGRADEFKEKLLDYASHVSCEEMDAIEASLLNALVVISSGQYFIILSHDSLTFSECMLFFSEKIL